MPKSTNLETTTTWTCDFCGFEDIHVSTNKVDEAPEIPAGWILVCTFEPPFHRDQRRKSIYSHSGDPNNPMVYGIYSEIEPKEYLACRACAKGFKALVVAKGRPKLEPKLLPLSPPPSLLGRLALAFRDPKRSRSL